MPLRPEDFQEGVEAGQAGGAALDQGGVQLGRPAQRITGSDAPLGVQALWVQHREPGEQNRVEPVALGVLGVVGAQFSRPLRRHQHNVGAVLAEPRRERHPRVAGRLQHDRDLARSGARGQPLPQPVEVGCGRPEPVPGPDHLAAFIGQAGLVRCTDRDIDSHPKDHYGGLLCRRI